MYAPAYSAMRGGSGRQLACRAAEGSRELRVTGERSPPAAPPLGPAAGAPATCAARSVTGAAKCGALETGRQVTHRPPLAGGGRSRPLDR